MHLIQDKNCLGSVLSHLIQQPQHYQVAITPIIQIRTSAQSTPVSKCKSQALNQEASDSKTRIFSTHMILSLDH